MEISSAMDVIFQKNPLYTNTLLHDRWGFTAFSLSLTAGHSPSSLEFMFSRNQLVSGSLWESCPVPRGQGILDEPRIVQGCMAVEVNNLRVWVGFFFFNAQVNTITDHKVLRPPPPRHFSSSASSFSYLSDPPPFSATPSASLRRHFSSLYP